MNQLLNNEIKVVLIEDHHEIREGLKFIISTHPRLNCVSFANGETALDYINQWNTDIVLMDINLPGMNGIECTKKIKESNSSIQVMMCTVYDDDEKLFSAIKAGANGYILKKTAADHLINAILELHDGGSPMSSSIARKVLHYFQEEERKPAEDSNLSKRENEILDLLSEGKKNKDIAAELFVSPNTIRTHIYNIYEKLQVQNRIEALNKTGRNKNNT